MEIKVPEVGESIHEVVIAKWHKKDGEMISKEDLLCELETDKITLELNAEAAGELHIRVGAGETAAVGTVIAEIGQAEKSAAGDEAPEVRGVEEKEAGAETTSPAVVRSEEPVEYSAGRGKDLARTAEKGPALPENGLTRKEGAGVRRRPLSPIRRRIAERLVAAKQQTAMLTTFNEIEMSSLQTWRNKCRDRFEARHGIRLGLVSFFVLAAVEALREFPEVNAFIDGDDLVYHDYMNIGVAVGADKGLVVPVLRDAETLRLWEIEKAIAAFVDKIRENRLELADLEGGTFTITNGGVFGSLLSTPLLNFPQSAILGMHAIQERPVVRDGEVVIRPMMYVALSYDHRIIDGRDAVAFLERIKGRIEEPERIFLEI